MQSLKSQYMGPMDEKKMKRSKNEPKIPNKNIFKIYMYKVLINFYMKMYIFILLLN